MDHYQIFVFFVLAVVQLFHPFKLFFFLLRCALKFYLKNVTCKTKASKFSEKQSFFRKGQSKLLGLFFPLSSTLQFFVVVVFLDIVPSRNSGFRLIFRSLNFKRAGSALAFSRCQIC